MKTLLLTIGFIAGFLTTVPVFASGDTLITESGIKYIQISEGTGQRPVANQKVKIVYSRKTSTGQIVESNELSKPFEFRLDQHKVIPGLEEIVKHMTKGEELYCIIPPSLAHGEEGVKGYIDPNATLYLYIQIIDIE